MSETSIRSVSIMILAWQSHQKLSIISKSMNICKGQAFLTQYGKYEIKNLLQIHPIITNKDPCKQNSRSVKFFRHSFNQIFSGIDLFGALC
jgi:hypothetical protein